MPRRKPELNQSALFRRDAAWRSAGTVEVTYRGAQTRTKSGRFSAREVIKTKVKIQRAYDKEYSEVTYRGRFSKKLPEDAQLNITSAIIKRMREDGIKTLPHKRGTNAKVRFFAFVEGQAIDTESKKRVRAGTGISRNSSIKSTEQQTKSKVKALHEGASLANDPFKATGSGQQSMKQGPDAIYITAVYAEGYQAPIHKRSRRK